MQPHLPAIEIVDEILVPCLRSKTPAERLDMAAEMWRYARNLHLDLARHQHPDWSSEEVHHEARRRLIAGQQRGRE